MKYLKPASRGPRAAAQVRGQRVGARRDSTSRLMNRVMSSADIASRLMPAAAKSISA